MKQKSRQKTYYSSFILRIFKTEWADFLDFLIKSELIKNPVNFQEKWPDFLVETLKVPFNFQGKYGQIKWRNTKILSIFREKNGPIFLANRNAKTPFCSPGFLNIFLSIRIKGSTIKSGLASWHLAVIISEMFPSLRLLPKYLQTKNFFSLSKAAAIIALYGLYVYL